MTRENALKWMKEMNELARISQPTMNFLLDLSDYKKKIGHLTEKQLAAIDKIKKERPQFSFFIDSCREGKEGKDLFRE